MLFEHNYKSFSFSKNKEMNIDHPLHRSTASSSAATSTTQHQQRKLQHESPRPSVFLRQRRYTSAPQDSLSSAAASDDGSDGSGGGGTHKMKTTTTTAVVDHITSAALADAAAVITASAAAASSSHTQQQQQQQLLQTLARLQGLPTEAKPDYSLTEEEEASVQQVVDSRIRAMAASYVKSTSWSEIAVTEVEGKDLFLSDDQVDMHNNSYNGTGTSNHHQQHHYNANNRKLLMTEKQRQEEAELARKAEEEREAVALAEEMRERENKAHLDGVARRHHVEAQLGLRRRIAELVQSFHQEIANLENPPVVVERPPVVDHEALSVARATTELERRREGLVELRKRSQKVAEDAKKKSDVVV